MHKLFLLCIVPVLAILQTSDNRPATTEKKQGRVLLLDGKSMAGWRTYKNLPDNGWEVVDDQLHCKSGAEGVRQRADPVTKNSYSSFEIQIDWKVKKKRMAACFITCRKRKKNAFETGPEYLMIDDLGYNGKRENWQQSGADYAMHPPAGLLTKPKG